jgi:hypothetical protein
VPKRELPRFEVVKVLNKFFAFDHLTKTPHYPVHPRSKEEAFGLVALLAGRAREKGEPLSVVREDTPPVKQ